MRAIFKTEMLTYKSKAKFDDKILFDKITHHLDFEVRKVLVTGKGHVWERRFHISLCSMIYLLLKFKILFGKLTINFNAT